MKVEINLIFRFEDCKTFTVASIDRVPRECGYRYACDSSGNEKMSLRDDDTPLYPEVWTLVSSVDKITEIVKISVKENTKPLLLGRPPKVWNSVMSKLRGAEHRK